MDGHELRLRHRAFGGIDQQDDAIDHRQDPLYLAAEIGVAGRVDDVDPRALPLDRGAFGKDRDAALALQIVAVHRALGDGLVVPEGAGLLQQFVDQRGFAMVDMGDDGDIAKIHACAFLAVAPGPYRAPAEKARGQSVKSETC